MKISFEAERCSECPMLRMDRYREFVCYLYNACLGEDIYSLEQCKDCKEENPNGR